MKKNTNKQQKDQENADSKQNIEKYEEIDNKIEVLEIAKDMLNKSEDENWEDEGENQNEDEDDEENLDWEEEGIIIDDEMELEFDENGEIIAKQQIEDEENDDQENDENSDMNTINNSTKNFEKPIYLTSTFTHHTQEVVNLSVDPSNKRYFVSGGMDDLLVLWDMETDSVKQSFKFEETVAFVEYGFDGKLLAAACFDEKIYIYQKNDIDEFGLKYELTGASDEITVI